MAHQEPKVSVWTWGLTKFKCLMNVETIMPRILVINRGVISNEKKNYIYSKSFLMKPTYIAQKRTFCDFCFHGHRSILQGAKTMSIPKSPKSTWHSALLIRQQIPRSLFNFKKKRWLYSWWKYVAGDACAYLESLDWTPYMNPS